MTTIQTWILIVGLYLTAFGSIWMGYEQYAANNIMINPMGFVHTPDTDSHQRSF